MSKKSFEAKLDFILEMIDNIEEIIKRHAGIVKSIKDFEGQMAILMGISQIGETLKKFDDDKVKTYNLEVDRDGAYYTRNYIVHDYEGIDLGFIENILRSYLPKLKEKILFIKKEEYGN
ncbi:MAG: HepT-like ribonuclease domain-containing protein [Campylobacterota bacterium]|nr:HepT-like ribonuclease domain-containing protein [Campylobacterota bacterium]